ncbi:helix-turn-helix transcriptional regulator [Amycolatopsis sp. FU40]|uniref:helix-turn-helix domain-containing protein n=1 Tax=Amycolatopsis sp. FU40 TaxID=2914159 RepID=UPI001F280F40|nr:helix-turn-helix transcriptional regulator [Amycolatopsis sp. FU40]UKD55177.1 helix-turn-helix transcriptional regulator [Amycolatopsis sp. FU40]
MDLRTAADLAGISFSYLGQLERGDKPVNNRRVLEALAMALRVSPTELTGQPWAPVDPVSSDAHASLHEVETALEAYELGHDPGVEMRPWPEIASDVTQLIDLMHVHSDYAGQGNLLPLLLPELHAAYVRDPSNRVHILRALVRAYASATWTTKRLGGRGLPAIAARLAQEAADELGEPAWTGFAAWLRGDATGQLSRKQQYNRSVRTADSLVPHLDEPDVIQAYGMLQLSAALASAAQSDRDTAATHLDEANAVAQRLDDEVGSFARLWFGRANVGIWRVSLATEFGDGPKVAELARGVHPELIPSPSRKAEFWADLGRSLLDDPGTRDKGMTALLNAEKLAPQRIRNDVFVREAVSNQLRRARRDAGGRELRGLAWRMGIAPVG